MILETGYFLIWSFGVLFLLIVLYNFVKNHSFVTVNCWFCNTNFRVPFKNRKEWFCEQCLQFNGFKEDGDYSKVLPEQFDETLNRKYVKAESSQTSYVFNSNGLCSFCNANQELKIKQLALYVPFQEKNYDEEIEIFRKKLEKSYKLCENCENFVHKKLQLKSDPGLSTDGVKVYKNATDRRIPARKYVTKSKILAFLFMVIGTVVACVFRTRSSIEHVAELFATYDFEQFLLGVTSPMCYGPVLDYFFVLSTAFLPYIFLVRLQSIVGILLVMLSLMISDDLIPVWKIFSIVAVVIAIAIKSIVSDRMKRRCTLQKLNYNLQNRFDLEYEKKEDCEMKRLMAKSNSSASFYGNAPLCGQFSDLNLGKCEKRVPSSSKQSPPPHSFKCDKLLIQPSKLKIDEFDYADTLRTSPTVSSGYESLCGGFFKKTPDSDFEFDSISQVDIATREHLFPNVSKNHSPPYTHQSHFRTMDALSFSGGAERYYGAIPIHSSSSVRLSSSSPTLESNQKSQLRINASIPTFQIVLYSITCFILGFSFQIFAREFFI
ncbi:uncharacterized protein LOC135833833 [Planococcus citri]|uniref:uncharacterized protein LOC135833833 n=1 Tax=Planococcus citri TaxID=170843 RepID=UPI0031F725A9